MTYWTELAGKPFRLEQVDAQGVQTRALVMGAGEPVIFLHGVSGHLEAFIPAAARFGSSFALHLIDMLGHGWTDKPSGPLTIDKLSEHVIAYMDAQGIAKAHLVGISLGGWVSGWMAVHYPDRVLSSILIAAAGNPAGGQAGAAELIRKSTLAGVMSDDPNETRKRIQHVVFKPETVDDEVVDVRYTIYHMPEFRANIEGLLALTDPELYQRYALHPDMLAKVKVPILLLWGEADRIAGIADAEALEAHLPAVKFVQLSNTGHWPPYERPDDFVRIATAFFNEGLDAVEAGRQ